MQDLKGMLPIELAKWLTAAGFPRYRGEQVFGWLQKQGATEFEELINLPKKLRQFLAAESFITTGAIERTVEAPDGTKKLLLRFADGAAVETVLLPHKDGLTICLSTQVGCAMGCAFCATGQGGLERQLLASEIVEQVRLGEQVAGTAAKHLVYMGMGEPLANYRETLRSIQLLNHPLGRNIGMRQITISTCGLVPQIEKLAQEQLQLVLAISLHGATDETRGRLMPINQRYPLAQLIPAAKNYAEKTSRRVSFEYAPIRGVNDSREEIRTLGKLLRGWLCHLNLIPLNSVAGSPFQPLNKGELQEFAKQTRALGINTTIRSSLGGEVAAACGQLRGDQDAMFRKTGDGSRESL